jgi:DNA-binding NarL/FixJ family response regulator
MRPFILADNQELTRAGWFFFIEKNYSDALIHEAVNKKELIQLSSQFPDSIIIIDYNLFDFGSINELTILQDRFKQTDWIICSDFMNEESVRSVIFNSTRIGILQKESGSEEFQGALKQANKGERYISSYFSNMMFESGRQKQSVQPRSVLTITEQEILKEMALGKSTREIAEIRHASIHTIMTHRKNIFRKIEVNNVHEATKYAMRAGLIDMAEYYI